MYITNIDDSMIGFYMVKLLNETKKNTKL